MQVIVSGLTLINTPEDLYIGECDLTQITSTSTAPSPCKLFTGVSVAHRCTLKKVKSMRINDGDYSGEVDSNGLPHGSGEMKLNAECWYSGEWCHGVKSGAGHFQHRNGYHTGIYEAGVRHGTGEVHIPSTGYTFKGTFSNDAPVLSVHDVKDSQCLDALNFCSFTR